jgi:maleylacetate reductase
MLGMISGTHTFLPTERVHFGNGSLERLAEEVAGHERVFLITGRTLNRQTDLVSRVEEILGAAHCGTFDGMSQHTPGSAVERAAELAEGADLLVSLGGGSVIDGTKAVAVRLGYVEQLAIPTTLSGAEWAHLVGVTDERAGRKSGFADPRAVPAAVILDSAVTRFTPMELWLSTGIRALDHAVEGYLDQGAHPVSDVLGLEGVRRLFAYLPQSKRRPQDMEVRDELQVAAWFSYFGPLNTPMGLSHALGRRIGASYNVPHGVTSCITLAPTLARVKEEVPIGRWEQLAGAMGGEPDLKVAELVRELELPDNLRQFGVPGEDLETVAREFGAAADAARAVLHRAW